MNTPRSLVCITCTQKKTRLSDLRTPLTQSTRQTTHGGSARRDSTNFGQKRENAVEPGLRCAAQDGRGHLITFKQRLTVGRRAHAQLLRWVLLRALMRLEQRCPDAHWSRAWLRGRARMYDVTRASHHCQLVMNQLLNRFSQLRRVAFKFSPKVHVLSLETSTRLFKIHTIQDDFIIIYIGLCTDFNFLFSSYLWPHLTGLRSSIHTLIHPPVGKSHRKVGW